MDINNQIYWSIVIFLREIEAIKSYLSEFEKDGFIKSKLYSEDCVVEDSNQRPIIFITYNKNNFNAQNG